MTDNKTVPNQQLLDLGTPFVMLAGQKWPIPLLSPKQNRIVLPLLLAMIPKIAGSYSTVEVTDPATGEKVTRSVADMDKLSAMLANGGIDDLYKIIYHALTKGHPTLTQSEFDDIEIGAFEMIDSIMVIGQQTGVMRNARKGEQLGEQTAAS